MNRNLRVLVLLVLLIIIPFLVYAFLQLSSLKEDEQMADEIYEKQMDAVLFSLNQYADDMTSQWIRQLQEDESDLNDEAAVLVLRNESIQLLVIRIETFGFNLVDFMVSIHQSPICFSRAAVCNENHILNK